MHFSGTAGVVLCHCRTGERHTWTGPTNLPSSGLCGAEISLKLLCQRSKSTSIHHGRHTLTSTATTVLCWRQHSECGALRRGIKKQIPLRFCHAKADDSVGTVTKSPLRHREWITRVSPSCSPSQPFWLGLLSLARAWVSIFVFVFCSRCFDCNVARLLSYVTRF